MVRERGGKQGEKGRGWKWGVKERGGGVNSCVCVGGGGVLDFGGGIGCKI